MNHWLLQRKIKECVVFLVFLDENDKFKYVHSRQFKLGEIIWKFDTAEEVIGSAVMHNNVVVWRELFPHPIMLKAGEELRINYSKLIVNY